MKTRQMVAAIVLACTSFQASAQYPVIDIASLGQAVKQVQAWTSQYQQMHTQIEAMKTQLQALTGNRGMATLLPEHLPQLPEDWVDAMINLSQLASQIRSKQAVLTPAQASRLPAPLQQFTAQAQNLSAANQAMAQAAFNDASVRQSRLHTLNTALAGTNDPKAAYDLANRIAIEHAALIKDQNQLEAAANGAAAQERAQRLMINQMRVATVGSTIPTIDFSLP